MSVRTLRFYDRMGLLPPSRRTESGYRLYTDEDLPRLQQILALKFLGFSLDEIKLYLETGPRELSAALAEQKAMVRERRRQLEAVARTLETTERLLRTDGCDWERVVGVIRVIQMEQQNDWRRKYFTEEQLASMEDLGRRSYSDDARQRLAELHPDEWTEEDQRRIDERYAALHAGVNRLAADGADPAGPEAQALARESVDLIEAFTRRDRLVEDALSKWWDGYSELPREQRPFESPLSDDESEFLERAKAIYRQR